uniref:Uncharacterized protein n=1 Tax=Arundo donax TaxID=35708 RepID=A0A0A9HAU7_ARUDO
MSVLNITGLNFCTEQMCCYSYTCVNMYNI